MCQRTAQSVEIVFPEVLFPIFCPILFPEPGIQARASVVRVNVISTVGAHSLVQHVPARKFTVRKEEDLAVVLSRPISHTRPTLLAMGWWLTTFLPTRLEARADDLSHCN